jgi:hypothetical protein
MKIQGLASDIVMEKVDDQHQPTAFYGGYPNNYGRGYANSPESGGKWPYSLSAPGSNLLLNHWSLRRGARVAMHESPQGRAIVERKVDAVAYVGLKLEPTPDADILGITQEQATEWAKIVGNRFHLYASDKKQNRSETMTLYQAMWQYSFYQERDNDIFVRLYYSPERNLQNPLQFEFIDPDQVRGGGFTTSYGFQAHHDGIVRDDRGRETGYKIWVRDKDGRYNEVTVKKKGPKSGRIFMLHGFKPEYAGQGRGYTKLAPIIQDLENATDFSASHIKLAINQSQVVGWVVPSKDEDATSIWDGNSTTHGVGPAGTNFSGDGTDSATEAVPLVNGDFECYSLPEATFNTPGSTWINTGYDKFMQEFLTSLSACSGVPLEVVHMKFGNNFSASRATLLLFQRIVEIAREEMVADFLAPLQEMWMSGEIAAGRISAPGWNDPRLRAAWMKSTWRGAPVPDIDPGKLAKAYREHIEMGTDSAERISQIHSGKSAADNISMNNLTYQDYEVLPFSGGGGNPEPEDDDEDDKED